MIEFIVAILFFIGLSITSYNKNWNDELMVLSGAIAGVLIFAFCVWGSNIDHTVSTTLKREEYQIIKGTDRVLFIIKSPTVGEYTITVKDFTVVSNPESARVIKHVEVSNFNKVKEPTYEVE